MGKNLSRTALKYVRSPSTNWYEPVLMSSARKRKKPQLLRNQCSDQGDSKVRAENDRSRGQCCEPATCFQGSDWLGYVSVATRTVCKKKMRLCPAPEAIATLLHTMTASTVETDDLQFSLGPSKVLPLRSFQLFHPPSI